VLKFGYKFILMSFYSMSFNVKKRILFFVCLSLLTFASVLPAFAQDEQESDDPLAIFNKGQDAHEKGDLETALKFYDEALKLLPEFPEAQYQRGNAFIQMGKADEAEKAFRRALEIRDDWTLAMAQLGALLVKKNQFAEAEKLLTKAVELDEQNFPAFDALTELRIKTKAAPEVLKQLLGKIQVLTGKAKPTASIWASRAALERALGERQAAKESVKNSLSIDAKNITALNEKIEIAISEGDFTSALADAKTIVQLSKSSANANLTLARVYAASGNMPEAAKILDSLNQNDPTVIEFKKILSAKETESIENLEKILENEPKNVLILERLCTRARTENPQKALDYCRRASELEPDNVNHAVGFGAALVQAKRFPEAANLLLKLKEIAPDNYTARANLAAALFQLKRYAEAKTEYTWLTEKQPELSIGYYFLAIAHDNLGEYMDAMANYQQFLRLADPKVNQLEIDKVNLRLPSLQKLVKQQEKKGKGKK
jgi:tetratricopeptide (TPR) repeat protein